MIEIVPILPKEVGKLEICYDFGHCFVGSMIVASTPLGLCYAGFADDHNAALSRLEQRFEGAKFEQRHTVFHDQYFEAVERGCQTDVKLHLLGTDFQIAVWRALIQIPYGMTTSYMQIAECVGRPRACRAVGSAVGRNPVVIVVPCHRVIGSDGSIAGFTGGIDKKIVLLEKENVLFR